VALAPALASMRSFRNCADNQMRPLLLQNIEGGYLNPAAFHSGGFLIRHCEQSEAILQKDKRQWLLFFVFPLFLQSW